MAQTSRKSSRRRRKSRRKSPKKTPRKSPKRSRRQKKGARSLHRTKIRCRSILSDKIRTNIKEYHSGRFVSRSQAIAVSFSQVRKSHPWCSRYLGKK